MMKNSVRAFAPATVANFVCGYDILGFAVNNIGDEVVLSSNDSGNITFELAEGPAELATLPEEKNIAIGLVKLFLSAIKKSIGIHIQLYKRMPLNSGMGSSSASGVAVLMAINHLFDAPFTKTELVSLAIEGERIACGAAHADNVAPAMLGGIVLVKSYEPLQLVPIASQIDFHIAIIHPHINVPTSEARKIIKERVLLKDAVMQWGNIAGLMAGLYTNDAKLIGSSMKDIIIEPTRALLIPGFYDMQKIAMKNKAIGFGISGSGPSVFALCHTNADAININQKIKTHLQHFGIISQQYATTINHQGAVILN